MDRELAKHVASIALAGRAHIQSALYALEKHCPPTELPAYRQAIANAEGCIDREILDRLYSAFPDLQSELESRIKKFGHLI